MGKFTFFALVLALVSAILGPVLYGWFRCPACGRLRIRETGNRIRGRWADRIELRCRSCGFSEYRDEPPAG